MNVHCRRSQRWIAFRRVASNVLALNLALNKSTLHTGLIQMKLIRWNVLHKTKWFAVDGNIPT